MDDYCQECGFDARTMSIEDVIAALRLLPEQIGAVVAPADADRLRLRPDAHTWSAIEYLGHLRDLMAFHRWVIEQALSEDRPVLAPPDPDSFVADSQYQNSDRDELLAQFDRRVDRLAALLESLPPEAFTREVVLEDPVDVKLVARSALHEGVHHRADLARLVATS
jgi:hypothetical protein